MTHHPTLLCLFPLGSELRQFGHSGLLGRLLQRGWRVLVAAKTPDDDLKAQLDPGIELVELPFDRLSTRVAQCRALLDLAHSERERRLGKTGWEYKKVVVRNWKQRGLFATQAVLGKALSFSNFGQRRLAAWEAAAIRNLSPIRCDELLRSIAPDIILLNVPRSDAMLPLLSAAQARRIPAVLLYHTWKDVTVNGRLNFSFAHYGVWNESMRAELLRQNPWINPQTVSITGCGHFQCVGRQDLLIPEAEFRAALGARPHSKLVFYPASAPWLVPEEERYICLLHKGLKDSNLSGDVQIVVRLNPMDADGRLGDALKTDAPDILVSKPDWRWDKQNNWCFQRRRDQLLYNSLLQYASACVGMPSTVTVECAVADVPVINIGFDLAGPAVQPGMARKFWEADFYEEVRRAGAASLVESPEDFSAAVAEAIALPELSRQSRKLLLQRQLGIAPHASVEAALRVLLETAQHCAYRVSHA